MIPGEFVHCSAETMTEAIVRRAKAAPVAGFLALALVVDHVTARSLVHDARRIERIFQLPFVARPSQALAAVSSTDPTSPSKRLIQRVSVAACKHVLQM